MIFKKITFHVLFLFSFYAAIGQTINSAESVAKFELSNFGLNTVEGTFTGLEGEITFASDDLPNANFAVCLDANTVNTGNNKRDEHLKKDDYFDVEKYPTICYNSTEIVKTETGYKAIGLLNLHGQSQAVEIPFTYKDQTFQGTFTIKRTDYGVGPKGGFAVGKEVEIQIICKLK